MGSYVPNSVDERREMLDFLGISSIEELYGHLPGDVKLKGELNLPKGKSELEVRNILSDLADRNKIFKTIFRGAGAYNHYIPSIVKAVTSKERFITAYTPYQPEISQGVLQAIFEYQTIICEITGMDTSNASLYDGASAAAEATAMCADNKKKKVLVSATSNPNTISTIKTYCEGADREFVLIPSATNGITDKNALKAQLEGAACFYVEMPNFNGIIEDYDELGQAAHEHNAKFIMGNNPIALGVLKTPAAYSADIAVGEGQPLGLPMSFGGPYLGFMACKSDMSRKLPGRIVGQTVDAEGKRAFVLTLQAREQHIRREKASSNVCSNQALCALTATAYVGAMGSIGLEEAANLCYSKAHYAAGEIAKISGFALKYPEAEFFHEFVTNCPVDTGKVMSALEEQDILGGLPVEGGILWCVTEQNTKEEIDKLCQILKEVRV